MEDFKTLQIKFVLILIKILKKKKSQPIAVLKIQSQSVLSTQIWD